MRVEFLDSAKQELIEVIAYYNSESEGLGYRFAAETRKTVSRIVEYPEAWPILSKRTKRCRISGFPYGVVYQVRKDAILLVAVMHLHRDPEYWKSRLKGSP